MCLRIEANNEFCAVEYILSGSPHMVFVKLFRLTNDGRLRGYVKHHKYETNYSESKGLLYVPPRIKQQQVMLKFRIIRGWTDSIALILSKMRLGYHASLVQISNTLQPIPSGCALFPVAVEPRHIMLMDNDSVVFEEFKIPEVKTHKKLYWQVFTIMGANKGEVDEMIRTCEFFFDRHQKSLNRRSK